MEKIKNISWYFGVFLTIIFLIVSIIQKDLVLAICGFVLGWQLKKSMHSVPLPRVYQKLHADTVFDKRK